MIINMDERRRYLCDLNINDEATIKNIDKECEIKRRLYELGFVPGSWVKCCMISPLGDPAAFLIKNTMIAVRSEDSGKIEIF